jgi:hypothetical protein
MGYQFRIAPEIEQWAARVTAPLNNAWRGRQERATAASQQLMAEINTFRAGKEATKTAYAAAEEVAKTVRHR